MNWVLVNNNSPHTIGPAEDDITSPTPAPPEISHLPPASDPTEMVLEPTADKGDRPAAIDEPDPTERNGEDIAPEPAPLRESDQVRKPKPLCVAEGVIVEFDDLGEGPAAVNAMVKTSGRYLEDSMDLFEEVITLFLLSPLVQSSPESPVIPPASSNSQF